jgi:hypothetical protein
MRTAKPITLFLLLTISSLVSCNKQKWETVSTSKINFSVSDTEVIIAGKSFIMDTIQLQLTDLNLTGERLQSDPISLVHSTSNSVDFLNQTGNEGFDIPIGTYTSMNLSTNLLVNGDPSIKIAGTYFFPNNTTYEISIALDIENAYFISLNDTDGSSTILIDENSTKSLQVSLDTEILFSDITPGLWNAAAVTSQNGSQTIVVNELNNANIYNALNSKIGESLIAQFQ